MTRELPAYDDTVLPHGPRRAALATAAVFALNGTVIAAWISRLPATRDRLEADPRTIGLTLLTLGLGSLVAMPFVGRLAHRFSSGPVVIVTSVVSGLGLVAAALAPTVVTTGIALFAMGTCYGSWDVAMNIQGSYVDRRAGRDYMPRYHACWSVGAIVGAACGALAAGAGVALGVHFAVAAAVAVSLTIVIVLREYLDDREPDEVVVDADGADPATGGVRKARLLTRRIVLIGVITLCGTLLEGSAADWVTLYLTDDRAQTQSAAAFGYTVFAMAMALSRFGGTPMIARLGRGRAVRIAGVLAALGITAALALPAMPGILIGIALWGVGTALVFPAAMSAGGEQPGRAADAIAAVSTIGYGGFLIGPPLIGLLAQQVGIGTALWILPALAIGIVILAPVVAPPGPRESLA
ncbi:MAG TPA: MFS transporter [Candidatus Nanopelagicales bacterium]